MVDLETIKPGDRVVVATFSGIIVTPPEQTSTGRPEYVQHGEEFVVAKPSVDWMTRNVRLEWAKGLNGILESRPEYLRLAAPPVSEPEGCTCDTFRVLMVRGCQCGWLKRERAAKESG